MSASNRPKDSPLWACPRCYRIASRLLEVRYGLGLEDVGPTWMCGECLDDLNVEEADYSVRGDYWLARAVWAIEIVRVRDASPSMAAAPSASHSSRRRRRGSVSL